MKIIVLTSFAILAFATGGCASNTDTDSDTETADEPSTTDQSSALRNTGGGGGGDPDECMASLAGCYQSCAKSGDASCYRYCDIVYAQCRGLPPPELTFVAKTTSPTITTATSY